MISTNENGVKKGMEIIFLKKWRCFNWNNYSND